MCRTLDTRHDCENRLSQKVRPSLFSGRQAASASGFPHAIATSQIPVLGFTGVSVQIAKAASPRILWQNSKDFTSSDGTLTEVDWSNAAGDVRWISLASPNHVGDLSLPALPASLQHWLPETATSKKAVVTVVDADYIADYSDMRQKHGPDIINEPFPTGELQIRLSTAVAK